MTTSFPFSEQGQNLVAAAVIAAARQRASRNYAILISSFVLFEVAPITSFHSKISPCVKPWVLVLMDNTNAGHGRLAELQVSGSVIKSNRLLRKC
ncbi:hypothetical protein IMY05_010G0138900 [Salix suchowensis]|nr:hypothetical protein IMY05_010G0138900 [Salix suchowensis]